MKHLKFIKILLLICVLSIMANAQKKTVLIIESYHTEFPWDASYISGIKNTMGENYKYVIFQMDTKRLSKELYSERADMAWEKYLEVKPDMVMLGDDNALKLLGQRFGKTKTPVIYLGINNNPRAYNVMHFKNITGVLERPLLRRAVAYLKKILHRTPKKILILFDSGTTSKVVGEDFKEFKGSKLSDVEINYLLIGNFTEWQNNILNLKKNGYDAVIIGLYQTIVDDEKKHIKADDIIKWTSSKTPVPLFCFWDFAVGSDKAAGGYVLFGKKMGILAGKLALEVFSGKSPSEISPIYNNEGRFYFSRTQLKKWNLNLPDNIRSKSEFTD